MSQEKNSGFSLRKGQQDLVEYLPQIKRGDCLTIQWPTGYGKSIGFALAWKHCHAFGIANRFLLVVANDTQRQQIITDFAGDCTMVDAPCPDGVWSFDRSGADLRMAKIGDVLVFVSTVQQLEASMARGGLNTLKDMLQTPGTSWMIGFDEFHHYGESMAWGDAAKMAMNHSAFTVAMSATPYRRGADTIFQPPELVVTYKEARDSGCVKPVVCHSYEYAVAVIEEGKEVMNYTTSELQSLADGQIDVWEERKNIRYSPQYLHPLIVHPLRRLRERRAMTGKRLQMLVRAMSCRHAKMLCDQIKLFAEGLETDWIGTNGRSEKENRAALTRFCPPKNKEGKRPDPSIDVLVQVAMAGEGFDSINVCEIIDLFPVGKAALSGKATQDKQFYGRGARIIAGCDGEVLRVNVPSDHPLHAWAGKSLSEWMDSSGGKVEPRETEKTPLPNLDFFDFPELPKQREIELMTIIKDTKHFQGFAQKCAEGAGYDIERDRDILVRLYLDTGNVIATEQSKQARAFQVREYLDSVVGRCALIKAKQCQEISGAVIGRYKKEVNAAIKRQFGKPRDEMTEEELEATAGWLHNYLKSMKGLGI